MEGQVNKPKQELESKLYDKQRGFIRISIKVKESQKKGDEVVHKKVQSPRSKFVY